ncbi:two-component system response regulator KdpE [Leeia oryzae]|uniref:two-component system response regulator KdpE n=1 Tax=Leeia oryzae TaxID=356662 RepID=UPI000376879E|nr:two-component system response regulator KdpE [Leeia oryzae]
MEHQHIVLIEDDAQIRRFVRSALEGEGYKVHEADTAARGLIEAGTRKPDLLIVDLGLPDLDGVSLIRDFRSWSQQPVLILSARVDESDKIEALDAGGDDYLTKPFGVGELLARVRALLRRRTQLQDEPPLLEFGEVCVDLAHRKVMRNAEEVHLTPIEYRLLLAMIGNAGKVLTHRSLMQSVWGPNHTESGHYLRIYVSRLRQKLEVDPARPQHFLTETGVGYRFETGN